MKRIALTLAFALTLSAARPAHAEEWTHRLSLSGSITFGVSYAFVFGLGLRYREPRLFVPVVGPLLELGRCRDCAGNSYEQPVIAVLILDSLAQATGVTLMARRWYQTRPQVAIAPTLFESGGGLVAVGTF